VKFPSRWSALVESSLHDSIKEWYFQPRDKLEESIGRYVIDIVRGEVLVEIQTKNFSTIKKKLEDLLTSHRVRLIYPVHCLKWIVRLEKSNLKILSRRKSPKKGRVEDIFSELVYISDLLCEKNFSLEVVLVHSEEVLVNDGRGSWRRRGWSIHDRKLLKVIDKKDFNTAENLRELLPIDLPPKFTTLDLSKSLAIRVSLARKMVYCLRKIEVISVVGKRGRMFLYSLA
jgi:hypothetical protein